MKILPSEQLDEVLRSALADLLEMDGDVAEFFGDCLEDEALYVATQHSDEIDDTDSSDLWDLKSSGFECGLRAAAKLGPKDKVFSASLDPDDFDADVPNAVLWLHGRTEGAVAKRLEKACKGYLEKVRQEKGLLPFKK